MIDQTFWHNRILEKLGSGEVGVVCEAHDIPRDRFVALKILPTEKVINPDHQLRLAQETNAVSSLSHPLIVTIYDSEIERIIK